MSQRIQVLNASYEPLTSTTVGRAVSLVLNGDAVIHEHNGAVLRSVSGVELPLPISIRLERYVRVPFTYSEARWSKAGVLERDGRICGYCGKNGDTIDHIIPRSRFKVKSEADTWENTVTSCYKDNSRKADRTPEEADMELRIEPTTPVKIRFTKKGTSA